VGCVRGHTEQSNDPANAADERRRCRQEWKLFMRKIVYPVARDRDIAEACMLERIISAVDKGHKASCLQSHERIYISLWRRATGFWFTVQVISSLLRPKSRLDWQNMSWIQPQNDST
jgi:hypothetical protein